MDIYYAIAEPNRRLILEELALHGQMAASDIAQKFKITAAAISQHLKVLLEAGLVTKEKQAQRRLYSINTEGFEELDEWVKNVKRTWEARLDNLERYLENSK